MTTHDKMGDVGNSDDQVRKHVIEERTRRGIQSARQAAVLGGVSNTTWTNYENGTTPLGDKMRAAVVKAFDWPVDWPEHLPELTPLTGGAAMDVLLHELRQLTADVAALQQRVEGLERER